ncbi:hypothetical protein BJ944DRAFT_260418 [Cunninghamella echinulata]|nr:hypothetical protein BJ944DRAFT_260418 [Cunninghamella echinulata]
MEEQNGLESSNISRATQTSPQNNHRPVSIYSVSSRRVRLNWFEYLRNAWGNISRTNKIIIGTSFIVGIIQIIITIVMLIIGRNDTCDKPLHVFLIIFVIRSGCSLPLMLYQHLRPTGYLNRNNNNNNNNTNNNRNLSTGLQNTENGNENGHHHQLSDNNTSTTTSTSPVTDHSSSSNSTMPSITQSTSSSSSPPTSLTNGWIDRIKSLLDLISILWFIVGNYLLFTVSDECHITGKHLFYTILAWVLLGYFLILIPLILCATIIFCLPCLLVMMRAMNVDYATGMVGANKSEIQEIPIYKFKQSDIQQQQQDQPNTSSNIASNTNNNNNKVTNPNSSTTSKFIWVRRIFNFPFKKKNSNTDLETNYESVTFDSVDATCTICLSNYENDDLICVLPCNHHFHKDCVHEWLALNYKCPLCQRDFRGKKVEEE